MDPVLRLAQKNSFRVCCQRACIQSKWAAKAVSTLEDTGLCPDMSKSALPCWHRSARAFLGIFLRRAIWHKLAQVSLQSMQTMWPSFFRPSFFRTPRCSSFQFYLPLLSSLPLHVTFGETAKCAGVFRV